MNPHIRAVCDQYAADGYVALAPDLFWCAEPRIELAYDGAGVAKGVELAQKADINLFVADIAATAGLLRARSDVAGKLAAIGYCFGGRLAYLAAATGKIDAAVAYYGGGIQSDLGVADKIVQPILFHYAENDHAIPMSAVDDVKAAFAGRDNAMFHLYMGAEHGFNCADRASYNQRAAALARGRTLTFLAEHL